MIAFPSGAKVWIAGGVTDMRCGMNSLARRVQQGIGRDPHGGEIFCFRGRKGDLIKVLWHDGVGMSLYIKRLEAGKFIWPVSQSGAAVPVSAAQLGYLLEGIDWRNPRWTQRPASAGCPAPGALRPAGECFRRDIHRQPGDEPDSGRNRVPG